LNFGLTSRSTFFSHLLCIVGRHDVHVRFLLPVLCVLVCDCDQLLFFSGTHVILNMIRFITQRPRARLPSSLFSHFNLLSSLSLPGRRSTLVTFLESSSTSISKAITRAAACYGSPKFLPPPLSVSSPHSTCPILQIPSGPRLEASRSKASIFFFSPDRSLYDFL